MIEIDVVLAPETDLTRTVLCVEGACLREELRLKLKGTLAQYPGSVHWHYQQGGGPGTLEITWWPAGRRLWFKVAANRAAPWVASVLDRLKTALEASQGLPV